jgi:Tol biopolymer transport system component
MISITFGNSCHVPASSCRTLDEMRMLAAILVLATSGCELYFGGQSAHVADDDERPDAPSANTPAGSLVYVKRNSLSRGHGGDICVLDATTRQTTCLVVGQDGHAPTWSRDGTQIVYEVHNSIGNQAKLNVMQADGSNQHVVGAGGTIEDWAAWSTQRSELAFHSDASIYRVNADGTFPVRLTATEDMMPTWSADGESIAFVSNRDQLPYTAKLYIMDRNGGNERRLTTLPLATGEERPRFSPDGLKLTFSTYYYNAPTNTITYGPAYVGDTDGTNLVDATAWLGEPVTTPPIEVYWSPDMTKLAYASVVRDELRIVDLATDMRRTIATGFIRGTLAWDPSSRFLAFRSGWLEGRNLYIADVATDVVEQLTTTGDIDGHFAGLDWAARD